MFNFIKKALHSVYTQFATKIGSFFGRTVIDEAALKELELLLLTSDVGVTTTRYIIERVRKSGVKDGAALHGALSTILLDILSAVPAVSEEAHIFVLVGINGSGKTTSVAKLAHQYVQKGKRVLLVAADTFRAAAANQLESWAHATGTDIVTGTPSQDPASVVFSGCQQFMQGGYDILIIDTAGRLHTKTNLMNELAKVMRSIAKNVPHKKVQTLLTIDGMLGQSSFGQAQLFKECANVDGVILTKMDGTGKGGVVFAIAAELKLPVAYMTFGETVGDIKRFVPAEFVTQLLDAV